MEADLPSVPPMISKPPFNRCHSNFPSCELIPDRISLSNWETKSEEHEQSPLKAWFYRVLIQHGQQGPTLEHLDRYHLQRHCHNWDTHTHHITSLLPQQAQPAHVSICNGFSGYFLSGNYAHTLGKGA